MFRQTSRKDQQALLLTLPSGRKPSIRGVWLDKPGVYGALTTGTSAYAATSSHFAVRQPVPHSLYSSMCGRALIVRKYVVYSVRPQRPGAVATAIQAGIPYSDVSRSDRDAGANAVNASQTYSAYANSSEGFVKM